MFVVLGDSGSGKSSFIKSRTQLPSVIIGDGYDACTSRPEVYHNPAVSEEMYLDTRGLRDSNLLGDDEAIDTMMEYVVREKKGLKGFLLFNNAHTPKTFENASKHLQKYFGDAHKDFSLVILSHSADLKPDKLEGYKKAIAKKNYKVIAWDNEDPFPNQVDLFTQFKNGLDAKNINDQISKFHAAVLDEATVLQQQELVPHYTKVKKEVPKVIDVRKTHNQKKSVSDPWKVWVDRPHSQVTKFLRRTVNQAQEKTSTVQHSISLPYPSDAKNPKVDNVLITVQSTEKCIQETHSHSIVGHSQVQFWSNLTHSISSGAGANYQISIDYSFDVDLLEQETILEEKYEIQESLVPKFDLQHYITIVTDKRLKEATAAMKMVH